MNFLRFIRAVILVYVIFEIFSYYVHNEILCDCYSEVSDLFRKDNKEFIKYTYFANFIFTVIFVFIYSAFFKKHNITNGLIYGILIGVIISCGMVIQYITYPLTKHLLVLWIAFGMIQMSLCGLSVGILYNPGSNIKRIKLGKIKDTNIFKFKKEPLPNEEQVSVDNPIDEKNIQETDLN